MNFKKYISCCGIVLGLFISTRSFAQHSKTYYISTSGNDLDNGTKNKPFQTIEKLNTLKLQAGDTICFRSGQEFKGPLIIAEAKGSQGKAIVITSYGKEQAIINGIDSSAIRIYKAEHIKIQRLKLIGAGRKTGNVKDGLAIINSSRVDANDLDISGFQKSGLLIFASQNVVAKNISSHDNGSAGIAVEAPYQTRESKNIQLLNCRAENNPGDPTNLTNHSGNGIVVSGCRNVMIDHCTATNNGWDMPRTGNGPVGIWAYEADSVIIQHCLSYKNKTSKGGGDGGGYDFDGGVTNSVIQYCMSYGNQGSGYCIFQYSGASPWNHNTFRYNISEDDGTVSDSQAGIYVWNSSEDEKQFYDCDVYGNIIYNSKVAALSYSVYNDSKGIRFYNNVFVGQDSLIKGKDKIGDAKYWDNNWWSIKSGFNIYDIKDIKTWMEKTGSGVKDGKMTELNIRPDFKLSGKATITSASQLKNFTNYQLPPNSRLRNKPVYKSKYGISKIKL